MTKKFIKHINEALLEEQQPLKQKLKYLIGKIGTIDKEKGLLYIKSLDGDILLSITYSIKINNDSDIFVSMLDIEDNSDSVELLARLIRNVFSIISKKSFLAFSDSPCCSSSSSVIFSNSSWKK